LSCGTGAARFCAFFQAGGRNDAPCIARRNALAGQLYDKMSMSFFCSPQCASVSADVIVTCASENFSARRARARFDKLSTPPSKRAKFFSPHARALHRAFFRHFARPPTMRDSRRAKTL
jgi:hypothetical protein